MPSHQADLRSQTCVYPSFHAPAGRCGLARAGTPIDQTHPLDAHGRIEISNVSGEVKVTGWDKPEVHITGVLGEGAKPLKIEGDDHSLSIKVEARDS